MTSTRHNLKLPLTPLLGRDRELAAVLGRIDDGARLVTLTGSAGFGKTRLATACALELARSEGAFPGGVWFVDLSPTSDDAEICAAVARALGLTLTAATEVDAGRALIGSHLSGSDRTLLVLDNLDDIVAPAASLVSAWLVAAPDLVVLATSRERLGVPPERCEPVGALGLPEPDEDPADASAVQLFVARATSAYPALPMTDETLSAIATLVGALDGNPLAIELAAARAPILSPVELLARLHDRFTLLTPPRRASHATRSLWDAIHLSWEGLTAGEREALCQLAVFRGGATLDAVEEALAGTARAADVLEDVQALVDKSLVRSSAGRDGGRRLTLYESIRAFALAKLDEDAGAAEGARARHRAWFVTYGDRLSVELQRPEGLRAYWRLVDELDNGYAVVEQALRPGAPPAVIEDGARAMSALHEVLSTRGPAALAERYLRALRALPVALPPRLRALLCANHCHYLVWAGDREGALAAREEALDAARAAADPCVEASVHHRTRGVFRLGAEGAELARAGLTRAVELLERNPCTLSPAVAREGLGLALTFLGRLAEAKASYDAALPALRSRAAPLAVAIALNNYAMLVSRLGDWSAAAGLFEEALGAATATGHLVLEGVVRSNLGECVMVRGDFARAAVEFEAALGAATRAGYHRTRFIATAHLAGIAHEAGRLAEAQDLYQEALSHAGTSWADPFVEAVVRTFSALCRAQRGEGGGDPLASASDAVARLDNPYLDVTLEICRTCVALHRGALTADATTARARGFRRRLDALARTVLPDRRYIPDYATRLLELELARTRTKAPGGAREEVVAPTRIASDGAWFVTPEGERVSLGRRAVAKRILALLACARAERPGVPISTDAVYAAGWPGDTAGEPHRSNRLYVMMSKLRKAGLGELLIHDGDGYQLDRHQPVTVE